MASPHPYEGDELLPHHAGLTYPPTARSPMAESQGTLQPTYANLHDSQYSTVPLNTSFDPYRDLNTPSPRGHPPATYQEEASSGFAEKPDATAPQYGAPKSSGKRHGFWIAVILLVLAIVVVAVIVPVYYKVIKPNNNAVNSSTGSSSSSPSPTQSGSPGVVSQAAITGGGGSKVTTETGSFIYNNSFGGIWYYDSSDPFNNNAQAQSWSPPLNTSWKWGVDRIRGVNLGGWLTLEPFITPALYEPYMNTSSPALDEWTLCTNLAADSSSGGVAKVIENHYKTFITEEDFAQIAGAGLNWVRIPFPYWAIETYPGEPFLEGVAWKYFLKAIAWARKYGIRINLDLHTAPGSQNGYNHSGKIGHIGWLNGTMGIANAQRTLNHLRIITEFVSQPQYKDVVQMVGIINEAIAGTIGKGVIDSFFLEAYSVIRKASGIGEGNGPWIVVHDAFQGLPNMVNFMPGSDRVALDTHSYLMFTDEDMSPITNQVTRPCGAWGNDLNTSMTNYGMTISGEFSNAFNDCGFLVNGFKNGARYDGTFPGYGGPNGGPGACVEWMDYTRWNASTIAAIRQFSMASMDALQNWFFWNWKIGKSTSWGTVAAPLWSYKLGYDNGFIPKNPRDADGVCGNTVPWSGTFPASKTGGAGAGTIDPDWLAQNPWPPTTLNDGRRVADLPIYTPTQTIAPLSAAMYTGTISPGSGWANSADNSGLYTPIAGCTYPADAWDPGAPGTACTGPTQRVFRGRRAVPRQTDVPE